MGRVLASMTAVAALALSSAAWAGPYGYGQPAGSGYDYAEVLRVDPIVTGYDRPVQRDQCWREPVTYREPPRYRDRHDRAPAVLGAIIGGVIGNQFGSGHGRDAATAAGALLGYHAVRDDQRRYGGYHGGREYTRYEQRCSTRTEYFRDERINGYEVTYRYQGQVYQTVTDYDPGDRLRVRVDVSAAP